MCELTAGIMVPVSKSDFLRGKKKIFDEKMAKIWRENREQRTSSTESVKKVWKMDIFVAVGHLVAVKRLGIFFL